MNTPFERGTVLYSQRRFDLAAQEFRHSLAVDPDNALAHALLALSMSQTARTAKQKEEACREANEAIRLGPDLALAHYARGQMLLDLDRPSEAEASAHEAIRLEPADPDHFGLLAATYMARRRWNEVLLATEKGLEHDAKHTGCTNLRANALLQLGRKDEAARALGSALADNPENALTHANQGFAYLHQGDHVKALEHFREALRLDPENEWARAGIVEALKARYLIYRLMLRFFLWMGRQSQAGQLAVIFAIIFGRGIIANMAQAHPHLAPLLKPILYLTFAFMLLTWIASPLFDLLLRLNRFGRLALSRDQRLASNWIGGCFILATVFFLANLVREVDLTFVGMTYFGLLLFPLALVFQQPRGPLRWKMAAITAVIALMGVPLFAMAVIGPRSFSKASVDRAIQIFNAFEYATILSTWAPTVLGLRAMSR